MPAAGADREEPLAALLEDSAEDLYESAPCGYLSTLTDGTIVKVNQTFLDWTGHRRDHVLGGMRLVDLLTAGGRIFHETHLGPLLQMQGEFREIAIDVLRADRTRLAALINAARRTDPRTGSTVVRLTIFDATDRRAYERELLRERRRAERNADRVAVLQEMVARCAGIAEASGLVGPVVAAGAQAFDAIATTVWLLDPDGTALTPAHDDAAVPVVLRVGTPEAEAIRDRVVVVHESDQPTGDLVRMHACTPLLTDDRTLGVVSFGFAEARRLGADELELMNTLGRQAGQALERARLHEETARRARQSAFLARMGGELDKTVSFADRARRLVELVVSDLAGYAKIEMADHPGAAWLAGGANSSRASSGTASATASDPEPWPDPAQVRSALAAAVDTGLPATLSPPAGGRRVTTVLPLQARGRVLGALLLAVDPQGLVGTDPTFLVEFAARAGLALENARLSDQDREVARTLQRSLLAGEPPIDHRFQVVAVYQSGVADLEVGGDWHDTFATSDDHVGVVVGDVVGRGIRAASAMGQLRSAVRALAGAGLGPAPVLDQLDKFVVTLVAGQMATVIYADLALDTGELRYACAGHPPPLLIPPSGEPRYLWEGRSGPVGAFAAVSARKQGTLTLARGSRLVLYTDGLVERRGESIDRGLDRLATEATDRRHASLEDMVSGISSALLTGVQSRDDVCLLALGYEDAPDPRTGSTRPRR